MPTPNSQPVQMRPVRNDPMEFQKTVDFLRLVWPDSERLNHTYLHWLYFANPDGPVIGMNAWSDDQLVGHYVVVPISACHDGQIKAAALSLNTAVHADFRGQKLFTRLAEETYALARQLGVDHIVGVANGNSTAGFTRGLRFQLVSPLEARILIATPKLQEAAATEPLWQRMWTASNLEWRLKNPAFAYTFCQHRDFLEVNGQTPYPMVKSLLTLTPDPGHSAAVRQQLTPSRSLQPRLWIGLNRKLKFPAMTSFNVPSALRKVPLNLIFRSLSQPGEQLDAEKIAFSALDFDLL